MKPYYSDDTVTLHHGDALAVLREMPSDSVDCTVTSPPYFGLRDYGVDGQIGAETSPVEYVERLRELFAEVRRVLADDGTLWLNLGDSYYSGKGSPTQPDLKNEARRPHARILDKPGADWSSPKNLLGMPWRVAFALQDDGWILRNAVVWHKPNAMPESVTDRLSSRYEMVFMFSKSRRYWFDLDPIRERPTEYVGRSWDERKAAGAPMRRGSSPVSGELTMFPANEAGKNPGDVWEIATAPFPGAHFACFPPELARRCIVAGCKPGGTVLDPFSGSGTTGMVAQKHGRKYIGIDLNAEYLDLSLRTRLANQAMEFPA